MASILKLINKPSSLRILSTLRNPPTSVLNLPLSSRQNESDPCTKNTNHHLSHLDDEKLPTSQPFKIYPSFTLGYFLEPTSSESLHLCTESDESPCETHEVWADSVKKKRKKKMNKHKYRKLRKRLGRQT
ncbi:hypothetical protein H6P81_000831 [Aristolochia fimbriata]|uniref:Small ribosomal subunit protein mS38 n=1 Tax=Aristolochia fimbriata TaxID=158543 RepID=A0AAV7F5H7_ARIFI|nr:hypothetical protein H6P81_000831 [Aristolochia fimbriata]